MFSKKLFKFLEANSFKGKIIKTIKTSMNDQKYSKTKANTGSKLSILWFRNDLRLTDNATLSFCIEQIAQKKTDCILPFYCFDETAIDGQSRVAAIERCGPYRRNFLIESVENLKMNLISKLKSNLYIAYGQAEIELMKLVDDLNTNHNIQIENVIASKETTTYEIELEKRVENCLHLKNKKLLLIWDLTMIHIDDLPFANSLATMPDTFTGFRKKVETNGESNYIVRKSSPIKQNTILPTFELAQWNHDKMPTKAEMKNGNPDRSAILGLVGGEDAALNRMDFYFHKSNGLLMYKTTRNGLIGKEYSSKLSMWLANGCISARTLYWAVKDFEKTHKANESTRAFIFELLWRDFFKFHSFKYGKSLFYLEGTSVKQYIHNRAAYASNTTKWKTDKILFEKWCLGETGYPFVDANMKELNETGWMSNRGRQNVASFLTKDLEIDWRFGAEYFEKMLIDYDCASNFGNWQYVAGVGVDPRADRYFNVIKQAYDYDENGDYVRLWLPQLIKVPKDYVHCPFLMSNIIQRANNCEIGKDYYAPIVRAKFEWKINNNTRKPNKFVVKSRINNDY